MMIVQNGLNFIVTNMLLVTTLLAILFAVINRRQSPNWGHSLLKQILILPIGLQCLWAFAFHVFLSDLTSTLISWEYSPFEYEVGLANLGLGLMGMYAYFKPSQGAWETTTIMCTCFIGGSGLSYIHHVFSGNTLQHHHIILTPYLHLLIPVMMIAALNRTYSALR